MMDFSEGDKTRFLAERGEEWGNREIKNKRRELSNLKNLAEFGEFGA